MALSGAGPLDTATPMSDKTSRTENLNIEFQGGFLLAFLYYALIPCSLMGGWLEKKVQKRKLLL